MSIAQALLNLHPTAKWYIPGDQTYSNIVWDTSNTVSIPSEEAVNAEVARIEAEIAATQYQKLRAKEYPDFKEYLDGVVKGDQAQIQAYIDACLAVKEKYPKP